MSLLERLRVWLTQLTAPPEPTAADEIRLYSASWCPHCRKVTPTFRKLRRQYPGQLKLVDLSDRRSRRWDQDHIRVVPTLVALRKGEVVGRRPAPFSAGGLSRFVHEQLRLP